MITFKDFQQAKDAVEKIVLIDIKPEDGLNETIKTTLREAVKGINKRDERTFYNLMGSLFLNVMINRLNELGENAKKYAIIAREIIAELMHEDNKKGEPEYV